jgi:hypothetical protein
LYKFDFINYAKKEVLSKTICKLKILNPKPFSLYLIQIDHKRITIKKKYVKTENFLLILYYKNGLHKPYLEIKVYYFEIKIYFSKNKNIKLKIFFF